AAERRRARAARAVPRAAGRHPRVLASLDDTRHVSLGERRLSVLVASPPCAHLLWLPSPAEPAPRPLQRSESRPRRRDASHRALPRHRRPRGEVADARRRGDVRVDEARRADGARPGDGNDLRRRLGPLPLQGDERALARRARAGRARALRARRRANADARAEALARGWRGVGRRAAVGGAAQRRSQRAKIAAKTRSPAAPRTARPGTSPRNQHAATTTKKLVFPSAENATSGRSICGWLA